MELRRQAAAAMIDLLFLDESEARTHPYLAHCWARRGVDLRIEAPGQAKRRAMLGAFDPIRVELLVHTSASKCSTDFIDLLNALEASYGGATRTRPLVAVMDNGPIHTSKLTTKALAERPWLTVEWLPKYAPELNEIEHSWRDLKRHHLANRTFVDADDLDRHATHGGGDVVHQAALLLGGHQAEEVARLGVVVVPFAVIVTVGSAIKRQRRFRETLVLGRAFKRIRLVVGV